MGAGQTTHHSTMALLPALALGRPPQRPHACRQCHVHHTTCSHEQPWDTQTMTGRTWSALQARGRWRWTTRASPQGAIVSWTLLAEDKRVMTEGEAIVYVVDDDASLRASLQDLLESVGLRVAACASAQEFLRRPRPEGPSCLVLDVRLPGLSGLELQQELAKGDLAMPIIFITGHGDIPMSVQAMKAGDVDLWSKPFRDQDLLAGVHQALARDGHARAQQAERAALRRRFEALTPRQRDVMARMVAGLLTKQIAGELGTSEATVKTHRKQVMAKMQAESLADLVRIADHLRLLTQNS